MVAARERVLASGAFDAVDALVARRAGAAGCRTVLDAGGGTGHHLARLLDALPDARGVSCDVSVAAAKRAGRAHERAASVVADTWGTLPLLSRRFDLVTCWFAPRNMAEFARVLGDDGLLVVVTPDAGHLAAVRERYGLLGIEPDKETGCCGRRPGSSRPWAARGSGRRWLPPPDSSRTWSRWVRTPSTASPTTSTRWRPRSP